MIEISLSLFEMTSNFSVLSETKSDVKIISFSYILIYPVSPLNSLRGNCDVALSYILYLVTLYIVI